MTKEAAGNRKPCRPGEYIVIALDDPVATNTIIVQDAPSALDALQGRLDFITEGELSSRERNEALQRCIGRWAVTTGRLSFIYNVAHGRDGMRIMQLAGLSPDEEARHRKPLVIG